LNSFWVRRVGVYKEEPFHHIVEDIVHAIYGIGLNVNDIKMAYITWRNMISTTSWRTHSSGESYSLNLSEFLLVGIDIIPSAVVHPLSK
jgi:hypothetical protein